MSSMSGGSSTRNASDRVNRIYYVSIDSLHPHPLNKQLYGTPPLDNDFIKSIESLGILEPIVRAFVALDGCTSLMHIVSGHRRWAAAKYLGLKKVPVRDWGTDCALNASESEELRYRLDEELIESNRQRVKTPEQKAREFKELKRIESELARQRMSEGGQKKGKANLPAPGQARDKAAEAVCMKPRTAEMFVAVVEKADAGDEKAKDFVTAINAGTASVSRAYKETVTKPAPAVIASAVRRADSLAKLFDDADVCRAKTDGKFHLTVRNLDAETIQKVAVVLRDLK